MTLNSKKFPGARIFGILAISSLCLTVLYFINGCGKSGYPQPSDPSKNFSWKETDAKPIGACLAFTGTFDGAYENLGGIRLEIAGVNGPEDCPGCPFVPQEVTEFSPRDAGFNSRDGTVAFSYCPQKAKAYRWRMAGTSIFNRMPHATMTDKLTVVVP